MDKVKAEEFMGRKRRENLSFGEDHVWLGFEAERDEPSEISAAVEGGKEKVKRRRRERKKLMKFTSDSFIFLSPVSL